MISIEFDMSTLEIELSTLEVSIPFLFISGCLLNLPCLCYKLDLPGGKRETHKSRNYPQTEFIIPIFYLRYYSGLLGIGKSSVTANTLLAASKHMDFGKFECPC